MVKLRRLRPRLPKEETHDEVREDQEDHVEEAVLRAVMDVTAEDHHSATYPRSTLSGLPSHPWRPSCLDWQGTLLVIATLVKGRQPDDRMTIIPRSSNAASQRSMRHTGQSQVGTLNLLH